MLKIDLFLMNPPYGSDSNPMLCWLILKKLIKYKTIVICPPAPAFKVLYFIMNDIEKVDFPGIDCGTAIFSINNGKPLFDKKYKYKTTNKKTDYYIQRRQTFSGTKASKYGIKVRKVGVERECKDKQYLDITEEEYRFINKLIDESDIEMYRDLYRNSINGPRFLVPNLLSKTDHAYLVEEVKNEKYYNF